MKYVSLFLISVCISHAVFAATYQGKVIGNIYVAPNGWLTVSIPSNTDYIDDEANHWVRFDQSVETSTQKSNKTNYENYQITLFSGNDLPFTSRYFWHHLPGWASPTLNPGFKVIHQQQIEVNHHAAMQWVIFDHSTYARQSTGFFSTEPVTAPYIYVHTIIDWKPYKVMVSYFAKYDKITQDIDQLIPWETYTAFLDSIRQTYPNHGHQMSKEAYLHRAYTLKEGRFLTQTRDIRPWGENYYYVESEPLHFKNNEPQIYIKDYLKNKNDWYGNPIFSQKRIVGVIAKGTRFHITKIVTGFDSRADITVQIDSGPFNGIKALFISPSELVPGYLLHG